MTHRNILLLLLAGLILMPCPISAATLTYAGKFIAQMTEPVSVPFVLRVDDVRVHVGEAVRQGQPLLRYHLELRDRRTLQAELGSGGGVADVLVQLSQAELDLSSTSGRAGMARELAAKELGPKAEAARSGQALAALQKRRAALREKQESLTRDFSLRLREFQTWFGVALKRGSLLPEELTLTSPGDGIVIDMLPQVRSGGRVESNAAALTLARLDPIQLQIQIHETEVQKISPDSEVVVELTNLKGRKVPGRVSRISWQPVDADIGVPSFYKVSIDVENADHAIKPGYKALARITFNDEEPGK